MRMITRMRLMMMTSAAKGSIGIIVDIHDCPCRHNHHYQNHCYHHYHQHKHDDGVVDTWPVVYHSGEVVRSGSRWRGGSSLYHLVIVIMVMMMMMMIVMICTNK